MGWIRIHGLSVPRYGGSGGLKELREELEAENKGVQVPSQIRWLRSVEVRASYPGCQTCDSSVVAPVLEVAVFARLCKRRLQPQGHRYRVDAYEEVRPDAYCSRCCGRGHTSPRCTAASPRCALCEESHTAADHRCPVEGCRVRRGHPCPHGVAKCRNSGGPHPSQAMGPRGGGRLRHRAGSGRFRSQDRSPHPRRQGGRRRCLMTKRWRRCTGSSSGGRGRSKALGRPRTVFSLFPFCFFSASFDWRYGGEDIGGGC